MFQKPTTALVAALLIAGACAKEASDDAIRLDTGTEAVAALRRAPEAAVEAGTGRFEMTTSIAEAGEAFELRATGAFDEDAGRVAMEMDLGAMLAELAESTGETLPPGFDEPFHFVVDGTTVYLRVPMLEALTGTSGWLSATPEDLGQSGASLGLNGGYDASALLDTLRGVADDVEVAGQEEVRGVETTKYTATVSLVRALEQAPVDERERLEAQLDQLGAGDANVPVEVWVDAEGRPRRMTMRFDGLLPSTAATGEATVSMTMEFFDFGELVDIEVPSPDEVTPFSEVMAAMGDSFGAAGL